MSGAAHPTWRDLLPLLRCPRTGNALHVLDEVSAGIHPVDPAQNEVWLAESSGTFKYPVVNEIPILLPDAAVALSEETPSSGKA